MTRCILNKEKENNNDEASVSDGHLAWRKVLLQLHTQVLEDIHLQRSMDHNRKMPYNVSSQP